MTDASMGLMQSIGRKPSSALPAFFRFREVAGKVVVTSLDGSFVVLAPDEFRAFARGDVARGSDLWTRLAEANLLKEAFDVPRAVEKMRARKRFVHYGPNLHIVVVTLRCNESCVYCHASRADLDAVHTDMTRETAEKAVDLILRSTSPSVTIEYQGGEPLVNFPVMQHIWEYATEKNRGIGKQLEFTMVSNLSLMTEEKLRWLVDHRVQICTSIDGPAALHDKQRKLVGGSAHREAAKWIERINQEYTALGLDPLLYHVEALLTTTRESLDRWKEVVDTYVELGCRAMFLRPVDPFGWMDKTGHRVEYPRSDYMQMYRKAVDYAIELNKGGTQILERYASIFLTKILAGEDPNFLDIRWPAGPGIGQLAYNYDGKIFSCDEGRMLHEAGDDTFLLGDVRQTKYRDIVGHDTVRALAIASNLDGQPDCVSCAYQPYCGWTPVHNHKSFGTFFGRMRESTLCAVHKGIQDYLFEKIATADAETMAILRRWTTVRERTHFLQSAR